MYYDEDEFYLTPEEELNFDLLCEAHDPLDSYRYTDTLVINHDDD